VGRRRRPPERERDAKEPEMPRQSTAELQESSIAWKIACFSPQKPITCEHSGKL